MNIQQKIKTTYINLSAATMLVLLMIPFSCSEDYEKVSLVDAKEKTIKDQIGQQFAKSLSLALSDRDLRQFVKDEALKKFDGDFSIHVPSVADRPVKDGANGRSVRFIELVMGDKKVPNGRSANSYIDSLVNFHPLLQILIPKLPNASVNDWDTENFQPLVAFIPSSSLTDEIVAFDASGNEVILSAKTPPDQPVIVISENERLIAVPKQESSTGRVSLVECNSDPYFADPDYNYYLMEDYNNCTYYGGGSGSSNSTGSTCTRDSRQNKDELTKMIFNSMSIFKSVNEWFDGGQEIQITISFATSNGAISQLTKFASGNDS